MVTESRRIHATLHRVGAPCTWKLTVSYDGTGFSGWQVQPGRRTVQGTLERALERLEGSPVKAEGSGRTDAGVHAQGQVVSCALRNPIPARGLLKALNRLLPMAIRVTDVIRVDPAFHARHSAIAKTYEYRIHRGAVCSPFEARYVYWHPYPLDEAALAAAAPAFCGTRDFCSFASRTRGGPRTTVRTVHTSVVRRSGSLLTYRVRGSGFLYRMVRNLVGTLLEVGRGQLAPGDLEGILAARDRRKAGPTAPARGLFLLNVEYPPDAGPVSSCGQRQGAPAPAGPRPSRETRPGPAGPPAGGPEPADGTP